MLLELIATVTVGLGTAGIVLVIAKATRGRLPRWIVPGAAGAAMIAFTIWSEYSWYGRTAEALPEDVVVAWANEDRIVYRPWTYLFPQTNRFLAVDLRSERTHDELPGQRMVDLYLMGRWAPNRQVTVVVDCEGQRRADLVGGVAPGPDGALPADAWVDLPADDPVLATACTREAS